MSACLEVRDGQHGAQHAEARLRAPLLQRRLQHRPGLRVHLRGRSAVPLTALFREDQQWAVFVDDDGRAALREVVVGHRNGMVAEITSGLSEGDRVVLHPSNRVIDGVRITGRG